MCWWLSRLMLRESSWGRKTRRWRYMIRLQSIGRLSTNYRPIDFSGQVSSTYRWRLDKLSTDTRPTLDRHSADTRSTLDRHSDRYVDRQSIEISVDTSIDTPRETHDPIPDLTNLTCEVWCKNEWHGTDRLNSCFRLIVGCNIIGLRW